MLRICVADRVERSAKRCSGSLNREEPPSITDAARKVQSSLSTARCDLRRIRGFELLVRCCRLPRVETIERNRTALILQSSPKSAVMLRGWVHQQRNDRTAASWRDRPRNERRRTPNPRPRAPSEVKNPIINADCGLVQNAF